MDYMEEPTGRIELTQGQIARMQEAIRLLPCATEAEYRALQKALERGLETVV